MRGGDCVNQKSVSGADKDPVTLADIPLNRKIRVTIGPNQYFCFDRHTLFGTGTDENTNYMFYHSIKNPFTNEDFTKQQIIEILTQLRKGVFYFNKEEGAYAVPRVLARYIQNNFSEQEYNTYFSHLIATENEPPWAAFLAAQSGGGGE